MQFINVTGSFVSFMGFVLFCFFSVFSFNLTIYGCSLSPLPPPDDPNPHLYWFGNLTTVIALLAWPKTCVPWWSLTSHNNLSLCAVSVSGSLITSATVGRSLRLCLSFSNPFSDSISFCSVSVSFHSMLSCCLSSPLQAGKTGLLKKETRSWQSLKNRERCREEDREAFIVTGPRPQLCLTRSAAVATGTLKCLFSY